jgi:RimJ/RimL family protein N-acetyltransferase
VAIAALPRRLLKEYSRIPAQVGLLAFVDARVRGCCRNRIVDWRAADLRDGDLVLRAWEPHDQELLGTSARDPEIGRYLGRALGVAEGESPPEDSDAPIFAIVAGGGVVGVIWFGRGVRPYEVGYYLHRDVWGRGFATRSLRLVTDWMLQQRGVDRIVLCTHPENVRSQAVAERVGYVRDGVVEQYAGFKDGTELALRFVRSIES